MRLSRGVTKPTAVITHILLGSILIASLFSMGCETPGFMRRVHWKKSKTPTDISIDAFERGQRYEKEGNRQKAIEEYETAQKISPRPIVAYKLGLLYAADGQYARAKQNFEVALQLNPHFEEARRELATLQNINPSAPAPVSVDTTK